jgi:hypothetical protein
MTKKPNNHARSLKTEPVEYKATPKLPVRFVPMLFSTEMVQAIAADIKTVTRRIVMPQPSGVNVRADGRLQFFNDTFPDEERWENADFPFSPGNIIWVRETFYAYGHWQQITEGPKAGRWAFLDLTAPHRKYEYEADGLMTAEGIRSGMSGVIGWYKRPSLFMPKHAARYFLQVKAVRVERLHSITEAQAKAEGASPELKPADLDLMRSMNWIIPRPWHEHQFGFMALWCRINDVKSWEENPWVWVVEFERIELSAYELRTFYQLSPQQ